MKANELLELVKGSSGGTSSGTGTDFRVPSSGDDISLHSLNSSFAVFV